MDGVNNLWHIDPEVYRRAKEALKTEDFYSKTKKAPYILIEGGEIDKRRVLDLYERRKVPGYEVSKVEVIFNKTLVKGFEAKIQLLEQRHESAVHAPQWKTETKEKQQKEVRERVDYTLHTEVEKYAVATRHVNILPMFHGTNPKLFDSIFRIGFDILASKDSTDAGYFGRGLYNTSYAEYAWRVYSTGGLVLNWVAFYSAFPVIKEDMKTLMGSAKYGNYDAHYALVKPMNPSNPKEKVYIPVGLKDKATYDELVVFESTQVLPRYVVTLGAVGLKLQEVAPKPNKKSLLQAMSEYLKKPQHALKEPLQKKMDEIKGVAEEQPELTKEEEWLQDQIQTIMANEEDPDQGIPQVLKEQMANVLKIANPANPVAKLPAQKLPAHPPTPLSPAPQSPAPLPSPLSPSPEKNVLKIASPTNPVLAAPPPKQEVKEVSLESLYQQGKHLLQDNRNEEAFPILLKAADRGHAASQYLVGQFYKLKKDFAHAISYSQKAAAQHHPDALDYIGHCYLNGYSLPEDPVKAVACFKEAAKLGNVSSMDYVIRLCPEDPNIPKYVKQLADGGHGDSQWKMCLQAKAARNYPEAFAYGLKAADNGIAEAQDYVCHCFRNGLSTDKDPAKAIFYGTKAAEQGNLSSIEYLGIFALEGYGGAPKDDQIAYKHFLKAADLGRPLSQYYVGIFSRDGRGTDKNPARARKYLEAAKAQGHAGAEEALKNIQD